MILGFLGYIFGSGGSANKIVQDYTTNILNKAINSVDQLCSSDVMLKNLMDIRGKTIIMIGSGINQSIKYNGSYSCLCDADLSSAAYTEVLNQIMNKMKAESGISIPGLTPSANNDLTQIIKTNIENILTNQVTVKSILNTLLYNNVDIVGDFVFMLGSPTSQTIDARITSQVSNMVSLKNDITNFIKNISDNDLEATSGIGFGFIGMIIMLVLIVGYFVLKFMNGNKGLQILFLVLGIIMAIALVYWFLLK